MAKRGATKTTFSNSDILTISGYEKGSCMETKIMCTPSSDHFLSKLWLLLALIFEVWDEVLMLELSFQVKVTSVLHAWVNISIHRCTRVYTGMLALGRQNGSSRPSKWKP